MKKAAILVVGIFVVFICFSVVSCQKKETPEETESVTEPAGTVEKAAPEAGGYGEEKAPEAGGYGGEEKAPEAGGYGEKEEAPETKD
jgi:hypothetical protein